MKAVLGAGASLAFGLILLAAAGGAGDFGAGALPAPAVTLPSGAATAEVVLISDAGGWGETEAGIARDLVAGGAIVVGIDLPAWQTALAAENRDCVYLVADIEAISHAVQRAAGGIAYFSPIVAGIGAGGAQALAIASQTPKATVGRTIAVDPIPVVGGAKPLCTAAPVTDAPGGRIYGLAPGLVSDPVEVGLTPRADPAGARHARSLTAEHPEVAVSPVDGPAPAALAALLDAAIATGTTTAAAPLGLPVTLLPATPRHDTMAVILSGDGGWRDLDQQIGGLLQGMGIPVVGLDSLRYFWTEKTAAGTAADLNQLIARQAADWGVSRVLLVGYSFGADVLPAVYNMLSAESRARIPQVTLLAMTGSKSFEISVLGWIGADSGGGSPAEDVAAIDPAIVQCVYGVEEEEDPCPALAARGIEAIRTDGGHHFDGDYDALARKILAGLERRLAAGLPAAAAAAPLGTASPDSAAGAAKAVSASPAAEEPEIDP